MVVKIINFIILQLMYIETGEIHNSIVQNDYIHFYVYFNASFRKPISDIGSTAEYVLCEHLC